MPSLIKQIFSGPKIPKPVVVKPPALSDSASQDALLQDRKRRAAATGGTGNIVSSLNKAVADLSAPSKKSTLLGG